MFTQVLLVKDLKQWFPPTRSQVGTGPWVVWCQATQKYWLKSIVLVIYDYEAFKTAEFATWWVVFNNMCNNIMYTIRKTFSF